MYWKCRLLSNEYSKSSFNVTAYWRRLKWQRSWWEGVRIFYALTAILQFIFKKSVNLKSQRNVQDPDLGWNGSWSGSWVKWIRIWILGEMDPDLGWNGSWSGSWMKWIRIRILDEMDPKFMIIEYLSELSSELSESISPARAAWRSSILFKASLRSDLTVRVSASAT